LVSEFKGEYRLRVYEKRVQRTVFGPKRDGVIGRGKKLYNEELHNLYSWSSIIKMLK
jgi:hypothetical protein